MVLFFVDSYMVQQQCQRHSVSGKGGFLFPLLHIEAKKMRSVSHPGTHHIVFQPNLRSYINVPE